MVETCYTIIFDQKPGFRQEKGVVCNELLNQEQLLCYFDMGEWLVDKCN